ncbi:hypothetical protein RHGRI_000370 [Rhododendron griersonianum]|uniref:GH18 domain-containing protein n=1 Tax=Rhododendron griersonianum TaxID=479676 RepID=A0AAV6LHE8_9ERIC|nr:hypothetical protein RHGRI_000370 [Rhododendron griersonianum]
MDKERIPAKEMVLGLAYHGYAWTLVDPKDNAIGSPARGRASTADGSMSYKYIKTYLRSYGVKVMYNASYVANYCIIGSFWIGFDDVEAIKTKVLYAREKELLGYKSMEGKCCCVENPESNVRDISQKIHDKEKLEELGNTIVVKRTIPKSL